MTTKLINGCEGIDKSNLVKGWMKIDNQIDQMMRKNLRVKLIKEKVESDYRSDNWLNWLKDRNKIDGKIDHWKQKNRLLNW